MSAVISTQKLRGAYYTPPEIVLFLADWAIQSKNDKVLEQCFGDGNFLEATIKRLIELGANKNTVVKNLYGSEFDPGEFEKAKKRVNTYLNRSLEFPNLHQGDFFKHYDEFYADQKFDAIVGNPPFIRYQHFKEEQRERAFNIMNRAGLKPNRLTNSWLPFLISSSLMLEEGGRIGMVIPAEIMQVKYAAEARKFLSDLFGAITLITFKRIVFSGIQQEVILFLGEKTDKEYGINVIPFANEKCLQNYAHKLPAKKTYKPINHTQEKWTKYYLTKEEILLLRRLRNDDRLTKFGELAEVDVGIVTGKNDFFLVSQDQIDEYKLGKYSTPLVGRTAQIPGLIFQRKDWLMSNKKGLKMNLFSVPATENGSIPKSVTKYIQEGEKQKCHTGYKCRIRKPWYTVPSVWVSDALLFRQIYDAPKLILNQAKVLTTDTIHRVRFKNKKEAKNIAYCFHNSLTFAFSEIMGRSYGGGVLELEPNEAEQLPMPYFKMDSDSIRELDQLYRLDRNLVEVLNKTDQALLVKKLKLKPKEVERLRKIWKKLANRRNNRK